MSKFWLLKAEPDSRIVKGKDVKFSVDDFEKIQTTAWEGVRNYEARNLMKEMKVGDMAVFYHSNCKVPGIAALAKVSKEAYPDYTAWDLYVPLNVVQSALVNYHRSENTLIMTPSKTDKENPKWYMVDLTFVERAKNFIPLALLRYIGDIPSTTPPPELEYVGEDGISAIKGMDLVTRGRLSVQRVSEEAWNTIQLLAKRGGWEGLNLKSPQKKATKAMVENKRKGKTTQRKDVDEQHVAEEVASDAAETSPPRAPGRKRKREAANIDPEAVEGDSEARPLRRSGRFRK
ncbi:hypothetical protein PC9H_004739 [Pleurotus ostreatus]|uniref:EVE domain-containing protein n=1 Tax=Pleurotus ostreatus TaxID=5322 RepID=A0A8H6ZY95_PLEOS|nr:uncharacterized protein PC9H_004739 [Pleurotus ostreatus]KAF7432796.1 hypothetical protein PC9H_004739 [Pleurotus ostreatus]